MKKRFNILENQDTFIVLDKATPVYAGEMGRQDYPILEKEMYNTYKKQYYIAYPMEYWCSGILFLSPDNQNIRLAEQLTDKTAVFTYQLVVRNPVFY